MSKDFRERVDMCEEISCIEGTELGDAIAAGVSFINSLSSLGDNEAAEKVLCMIEEYCKGFLEEADDEYLEAVKNDVYKYFIGKDKPIIEQKMRCGTKCFWKHDEHTEMVEFLYLDDDVATCHLFETKKKIKIPQSELSLIDLTKLK